MSVVEPAPDIPRWRMVLEHVAEGVEFFLSWIAGWLF